MPEFLHPYPCLVLLMYSDSTIFKPLFNTAYVCTLELIISENQNYINFCNSCECQAFLISAIETQVTSND